MSVYLQDINKLAVQPNFWGWIDGMYLAGNDCGVAMRLKAGYEYEPVSRKLWRSLCKDAVIAVDVGAHTGIYSLDGWRAGAKAVVSIEPYHLNFARLVMNLRHSGFSTNYAIFVAAGKANALSELHVNSRSDYCTSGGRTGILVKPSIEIKSYPVKMKTLDSIIKDEFYGEVRVVKIDTERCVVNVLKGMAGILEHKPDLIIECIEDGIGGILKPLGYHFYRINENAESEELTEIDDLIPDDPITHNSPNRYATFRRYSDFLEREWVSLGTA